MCAKSFELGNGGTGARVQRQTSDEVVSVNSQSNVAVPFVDFGAGDGLRDPSLRESIPSSRQGDGVLLRDPEELVGGLIKCGVSAQDAAAVAISYYGATQKMVPATVAVGDDISVSSFKSKSSLRNELWSKQKSVMSDVEGQCYLHPVRWARRSFYLDKLGKNPALRDFVALLEPGDLHEQAAKTFGFYRVSGRSFGCDIVYHVANNYDHGVFVGSVWDCVASVLRTYPNINTRYAVQSHVECPMPLSGVVGASAPVRTQHRIVNGGMVAGAVDFAGSTLSFMKMMGDDATDVSSVVQTVFQGVLDKGPMQLSVPLFVAPDVENAEHFDTFTSSRPHFHFSVGASLLFFDGGHGDAAFGQFQIELDKPVMVLVPPDTRFGRSTPPFSFSGERGVYQLPLSRDLHAALTFRYRLGLSGDRLLVHSCGLLSTDAADRLVAGINLVDTIAIDDEDVGCTVVNAVTVCCHEFRSRISYYFVAAPSLRTTVVHLGYEFTVLIAPYVNHNSVMIEVDFPDVHSHVVDRFPFLDRFSRVPHQYEHLLPRV